MKGFLRILRKPGVYLPLTGIVLFLFGWYSGIYRETSGTLAPGLQIRENSTNYQYINPILFTEDGPPSDGLNLLKSKLQSYTDSQRVKGSAARVSVYFRDLNSGQWTGVNEKDKYEPGSILKIIDLITYVKIADRSPSILSETINYRYQNDPGQYYKPQPLPNGNYSVLQLLQQMIIESDNTATILLNSDRRAAELAQTYADLRLPNPLAFDNYTLSPQDISRLFRAIYNAAYISNDYAEGMLKLMTRAKFNLGLTAGVKKDTPVAHKFGEYSLSVNDTIKSRQLHDCGIIYYPKYPYLLCVMTEGDDFPKLEKIISEISALTYRYVDSLH